MAKIDTLLLLKSKLFNMKYIIFQYNRIMSSFSVDFMFLMLKWDDYLFYIPVMQIYILSLWKTLILQVDQANPFSVCEVNDRPQP